jgi:glycosyltransferase involved in cell wall biosynthesis
MHTSSLIILTRNEIAGVRQLLTSIPVSHVTECFAVDYHSTDGTVEFFRKHGIRVVRQQKPGRGEAFRLGAATAHGDYLIFFSPDGNEDPRDIQKLLQLLTLGFDMAVASRFMNGSINEEDTQRVKPRAWANRAFTFLANVLFRGHVTDTINGYRAITKDAFRRLRLDAEGFAIEYQMTIRALKLRLRIAEIPTHESPRIGGQSTAIAVPTGIRVLRVLLREIAIGKNF